MMKPNHIIIGSRNLGGMIQIRETTHQMTRSQLLAELERRKREEEAARLRAIAEKAERDKQLLYSKLSEDALLCIAYVPFTIAEVAWDYADTICDISVIMRRSETKRLKRAIEQLRNDYDHKRFKTINQACRDSETANMIMFQEELSKEFNAYFQRFKKALTTQFGEIEVNSLMMTASVYLCRSVLKALFRYTAVQENIVSKILGYEIAPLLPDELHRLYNLVIEFAGDLRLPDEQGDALQTEIAEDIAQYIADITLNKTDEEASANNNSQTKDSTEMTDQELFDAIQAQMIIFSAEIDKNINKSNKAAGVRARKASLELEKLMKQYRKSSVQK